MKCLAAYSFDWKSDLWGVSKDEKDKVVISARRNELLEVVRIFPIDKNDAVVVTEVDRV